MKFSGFGPGKKGGPRKLRYDLRTGEVTAGPAPKRRRTPGVQTRFKPHWNHALMKEDAEAIGAQFDPATKGTYLQSEKQLNKYLAREKFHGREAHWRQH